MQSFHKSCFGGGVRGVLFVALLSFWGVSFFANGLINVNIFYKIYLTCTDLK